MIKRLGTYTFSFVLEVIQCFFRLDSSSMADLLAEVRASITMVTARGLEEDYDVYTEEDGSQERSVFVPRPEERVVIATTAQDRTLRPDQEVTQIDILFMMSTMLLLTSLS